MTERKKPSKLVQAIEDTMFHVDLGDVDKKVAEEDTPYWAAFELPESMARCYRELQRITGRDHSYQIGACERDAFKVALTYLREELEEIEKNVLCSIKNPEKYPYKCGGEHVTGEHLHQIIHLETLKERFNYIINVHKRLCPKETRFDQGPFI